NCPIAIRSSPTTNAATAIAMPRTTPPVTRALISPATSQASSMLSASTRSRLSAFPWEAARLLRSPPLGPSGSRIWSSPTSDRVRTAWRRWVDFAERTGWDELLPDMLRSGYFNSYANSGARYLRHMGGLIRSTPLAGLRHTLSQVLGQRKSLFRMHSTLQAIKVPTLVMLGQHDYICRNAARLLSENIPGAVLHRI